MMLNRWMEALIRGRRERSRRVALQVAMTWLGGAPLPDMETQRWCNQQLGKQIFPERERTTTELLREARDGD